VIVLYRSILGLDEGFDLTWKLVLALPRQPAF
jgi:hypothetical protein